MKIQTKIATLEVPSIKEREPQVFSLKQICAATGVPQFRVESWRARKHLDEVLLPMANAHLRFNILDALMIDFLYRGGEFGLDLELSKRIARRYAVSISERARALQEGKPAAKYLLFDENNLAAGRYEEFSASALVEHLQKSKAKTVLVLNLEEGLQRLVQISEKLKEQIQ